MKLELHFFGALIAIGWMMLGYVIYLARKNPAIVDIFWALCVGLISLFYFLSGNFNASSMIAFILIVLWAFKLSFLLIMRLFRDRVDGRYERLDESWKEKKNIKYLFFFILQAAAAFILSLPFLYTASINRINCSLNIIAVLVTTIGFLGEGVADFQLQRFLGKSGNRNRVCEEGLWAYSRHPNYFFEWIFWVGQFIFALNAPLGWISIISPIGLLATLIFFSGIPPTEEQALASKGEAYEKYQRNVSVFIPWFRK